MEAYAEASGYFVSVASRARDGDWERPGLGEWSVLELVAHANRAHTLVEEYLVRPVAPEPPGSDYFLPENVVARARQALTDLGPDPMASVHRAADSALRRVRTTPADAVLGSPFRTTTLAGYLPSRVAELTIHAIDLQRALDMEVEPPHGPLKTTIEWTTLLALSQGKGVQVLLGLSGRQDLPHGFSLY